MKLISNLRLNILIVFLLANAVNTYAQEDQSSIDEQSITIYTDYTIMLQDASRIQYLPEIKDTITVEPVFEYRINPRAYKSIFEPQLINAASLKDEPIPVLNNGMITLGLGNYISPYMEVFYNSTYQRDYSLGVYAKHHSAHGKVNNSLDQKVYSGFNNNDINLYGKRLLNNNSTLSGGINFDSREVFYYGYELDSTIISDLAQISETAPRDRDEMESQRWMSFNTNMNLNSNHLTSGNWNYDLLFDYTYLFNITDDYHHGVRLKTDLYRDFNFGDIGMDAAFVYHNDFIDSITDNERYLHLNPYFKTGSDQWKIKLGLNTTGQFPDDTVHYHFYPNVFIQHNVSNIIMPYFSFRGHLDDNCINSVRSINPYVQRIPNIEPTNYAQIIDVGIKGNISKNVRFQLNGNYSKIDNMMFFVNDTSEILNNKFILEYTNVERFSGYGEVQIRDIYGFNFMLKANYYYYSYIRNRNNFGEKPWHKPNLDITFRTEYNLTNDIKLGADLFFIGKRYAKEYAADMSIIEKELDAIVDFNLYGEYKFSNIFSCFVQFNNIFAQKQYVWNNYHSLGFNALAGFKYSF